MNDPQRIIVLATLLGGAGIWLMLPRGAARGRAAGAVLTAAALGLGASLLHPLGEWTADGLFYLLAGVTTVAALATVTFRNPVYCAIWFGMTLTGTAGLFLFTGAEFLAVATLVVYAGAILVTFLFLLMLAQPEGDAPYDRRSWEALLAAATGATLVGLLTMTLAGALSAAAAAPPTAAELARGVLSPQHMAHFGGELFGRHVIAVEVAGTLLLAAVVGAAVIVAHGHPKREKPSPADEA
jgi:NADH-quinone oxidoreductase subunit J